MPIGVTGSLFNRSYNTICTPFPYGANINWAKRGPGLGYANMTPNPLFANWATTISICGAVKNNICYAIGGWDNSLGTPLNSLYAYDTIGDAWTQLQNLPGAMYNAMAAIIDNTIYAFGGTDPANSANSIATCYAYNIPTNTWSTKSNLPITNGTQFGYACSYNGFVYYQSGASYLANTGTPDGNMYRYDPYADTWTNINTYPGGIPTAFSAAVYNNAMWIVGGKDSGGTGNSTNWFTKYDFNSNTYTTMPTLPATISNSSVVILNDYLYSVGGDVNNVNQTVVYRYDFTNNKWTTDTALPSATLVYAASCPFPAIIAD